MASTKNIQSIERAFSILELFEQRVEELSVKEISTALELNKSTAFGLINTLSNLGYLQQNESNQKYSLGMKVLSLSNAVKIRNIIIRTVRPYLENITARHNETTHCAVQENDSVIYLDKVEAAATIYINTQIGTKNYMHCTAVGKCLLAYLPEEKQKQILSGNLKTMTYNTITNAERLKEELRRIRELGYAEDNEEIELNLSCVAVPVFHARGKATFAISVSGLTQRIHGEKRITLIQELRRAAKAISMELYSYEESKDREGVKR